MNIYPIMNPAHHLFLFSILLFHVSNFGNLDWWKIFNVMSRDCFQIMLWRVYGKRLCSTLQICFKDSDKKTSSFCWKTFHSFNIGPNNYILYYDKPGSLTRTFIQCTINNKFKRWSTNIYNCCYGMIEKQTKVVIEDRIDKERLKFLNQIVILDFVKGFRYV